MDLELHRLELRYADLRIHDPGRCSRLLASLAAQGQQVPVVVVPESASAQAAQESPTARYVLIDGHLRVSALRQMGCDTVAATSWPLSESEALVHHHHLSSESRTAFEQGWLLSRLHEQGLSLDELARRLCRSKSWVSRRLALVRTLPKEAQAKVRQGLIPPHAAMKYLAPLARANKGHCDMLLDGIGNTRVSDRELAALYDGWRQAPPMGRERLCEAPLLYLRTLREAGENTTGDRPGAGLMNDLDILRAVALRARQRVRKGLDLAVTHKHAELDAAWRTAQGALEQLAVALTEVLTNARPDDPDYHLGAA